MLKEIPTQGCPKCGYGHYVNMSRFEAFDIKYIPKILKLDVFDGRRQSATATIINDVEFLRCACRKCGYMFEVEPLIKDEI